MVACTERKTTPVQPPPFEGKEPRCHRGSSFGNAGVAAGRQP